MENTPEPSSAEAAPTEPTTATTQAVPESSAEPALPESAPKPNIPAPETTTAPSVEQSEQNPPPMSTPPPPEPVLPTDPTPQPTSEPATTMQPSVAQKPPEQTSPLRSQPEECVIEQTIEKPIPRELTEEGQNQLVKNRLKTLSIKGNTARSARRQKNLETIIKYLRTNGYITNNDVEKICKVKNSAAINYLSALEKQGRIIQLGRTGRRVRYRLREATS